MFNHKIDYYAKEIDKKDRVQLKGFNVEKLDQTLQKSQGEDVWIKIWERTNQHADKEDEFWETFSKRYNEKGFSNIKLQLFSPKLNDSAFKAFLDLINGEETTFWLELGFPNIVVTQAAIKNNVSVLQYHNCSQCTGNKWKEVLKALGTATMLKVLFIGDPTVDQVAGILKLRSEINNLKIFIGPDDVKEFLESDEMYNSLSALQDTIQFPSEIRIGSVDFKNGKKWIPNCGDRKLGDIIKELNARKNQPEFWKKVIEDAIGKKKMTQFARSKLMFIGKGRAGKTSTIKSLTDKEFNAKQSSTAVADAKGQIRIVTHDIAVSTWKPKENAGEVVYSRDFQDVVSNAKIDDRKGFVNHSVYERDERRLGYLRQGKQINGQQIQRGAPSGTRTGVTSRARSFIPANFMFGKSIKVELDPKFLEAVARRGPEDNEEEEEMAIPDVSSSNIRRAKKKKKEEKKKKKVTRTITIWDFGGQEVFYTVHHLFFTNNGVYCLVFDFSEMIKHRAKEVANLQFWLDSVTLYAEKAPIFIVATHVQNHTRAQFLEIENEVINPLIQTYSEFNINLQTNIADKLSFFLIENSLENKNQSKHTQVNKLRRAIEESIKKTSEVFKLYAKAVPLSWIYFMNRLIKKDCRKLTFTKIMEKASVVALKEPEVEQILQLYNMFGTILSFRDKKSPTNTNTVSDTHPKEEESEENILKEHIILSPQWLVDALKTFIYSPDVHHLKRTNHDRFKNEVLKLKAYQKTGILLHSTFKKLLAKPIPLEGATSSDLNDEEGERQMQVRYEEYSKEDEKFLMTFFQNMFLMSKFSSKPIEASETNSSWYVPSMCRVYAKPNGYKNFIKSKELITMQIFTGRRHPTGFFERVVCLLLRLSNQAEGVQEPHLGNEVCVVYLFGLKLYVSKYDIRKKKKKKKKKKRKESNEKSISKMKKIDTSQTNKSPKLEAIDDVMPETESAVDEVDRVLYLYTRVLPTNKFKVKMMLAKIHEVLVNLKKDTLGKVLQPKLLLLFERVKGDNDSDSEEEEESKIKRKTVKKKNRTPEIENLRVEYALFARACTGDKEVSVFKAHFDISINDCKPFDKVLLSNPEQRETDQNAKTEEVSYDCFIAHEWGTAKDGYASHEVAKQLKKDLVAKGLSVWLDEDNLGDNIALDISTGLTQSAVTILLLTKRYFARGNDRDCNAHKEFIMATTFGQKYLLALVVEEDYLDKRNWPGGAVNYHLADTKWIAFATEHQRRVNLKEIQKRVKDLSVQKFGKKKKPVEAEDKKK